MIETGLRADDSMPTTLLTPSQILLRDTVARLNSLATLPEVTVKIITTVEDPRSTAAQLNKLVSHDSALVARVLKVVNSAFYGLPGTINSVDRAIVMLGLHAVKNIAVAASLGQMFRGAKLCDDYTAKDLWSHCLGVAVVARELARRVKLPLADEAFLGGMIHDIGLLAALQSWPEQLKSICDQASAQGKFTECERGIVGIDHAQLGEAVAARWQFPAACCSVAAHHHRPVGAPQEHRALVSLVHIADILCCHAGHGFPLTAVDQQIDLAAAASLGIATEVIDAVRSDLKSIIALTSSFLA